MKQTSFTTIRLEADEDKYITQASDGVDISERVVAKTVNIGSNDKPENWKEITEDEAEEIKQLKNESIENDTE